MSETMPAVPVNPAIAIIQSAVDKGADPESLGKLLDLQMRFDADQARKAYVRAMAAFSANPPKIYKDKHVSFPAKGGTTAYDHATLPNVIKKVSEALSPHGLTAAFFTGNDDGRIIVTCRITHEDGHFEETTLPGPPDTSGGKNSIQAIGSTISYLMRYTILALCGLATYDMDDDGAGVCAEYISNEQHSQIVDMILAVGANEARFLAYMGTDAVEHIRAADFNKAMAGLKSKGKK